MRLVSPFTVLVFVIVWTITFLLASRHFLFSAHQVGRYETFIPLAYSMSPSSVLV